MRYIPMITKKEPSDIFVETLHSYFYHSFPPFIEKGKLTIYGTLFAVSLAVHMTSCILRAFFKKSIITFDKEN